MGQFLDARQDLLLEVGIRSFAHVQGLHGDFGPPAASTDGHEQTTVGLILGHPRVEVPVHAAARVRAADLGPRRRGRPHAAHLLHLLSHLVVHLALHTEFIEQLVDLTVVELHDAPAQQGDHLLGDLPGDVGIAIAVAAHPAAHFQQGGIEGQLCGTDAPQATVQAPVVLRHGLPDRLLNDQHAIASLTFRCGPRAAHGVGSPAAPLNGLDLVIQSCELPRRQLILAIVHLHLLQHLLVLLQGGSSLRFGGMRREDQFDLLVDHGLANGIRPNALLDQLLKSSNEAHHGRVLGIGDALDIRRHGALEGAQAMVRLCQTRLHQNFLEHTA
mmetsp:Transcript_85645/g.105126  ORF Transcript_85645/g.105126 Transcript_85645/m.105126 type:complete len:329 (+) Transcript_85645:1125-2111(+)